MVQWTSSHFWQNYFGPFTHGNIKQSNKLVMMDLNHTHMIIRNWLKDCLKNNLPKREKYSDQICSR